MAATLDHLVIVPENPMPDGGECCLLPTQDGVTLRTAYWARPEASGTVLILQGRSEFIEKSFEVVGELSARNFAVAAFDWRGQGGSERALADPSKGHVDDFHLYLRDLDAMLQELERRHAPKPWFALAHSMGGAILTYALCRGERRLQRAVLSAPMFGIKDAPTAGLAAFAAAALNLVGLGGMYVPFSGRHDATAFGAFAGNPLTSDPVRYQVAAAVLIAGPELAIGAPTVAWVAAALRLIGEMEHPEFGLKARCPMLFIGAGADTVVSTGACEQMGLRVRGASSLTIPGARHEILMERDPIRQQFWAAFDAFIRSET